MAETSHNYGTARRKTSVARGVIKPRKGKFTVNDKTLTRILRAKPDAWWCAPS